MVDGLRGLLDPFALHAHPHGCDPGGACIVRSSRPGREPPARAHRRLLFEELFSGARTRVELIITFLALLEMIRMKQVRVFQQGNFGPIRVYKREPAEGAPAYGGAGQ